MNKALMAAGGVGALVVGLAVAGVTYVKLALPKVGPVPELEVELTPARLERGAYLVNYVVACPDCHSPRSLDQLGFPSDESRAMTGGFALSQVLDDIPGDITTQNLTPVHLGSWSDGEIYRAIAEGVGKDGRPLFPMMPYDSLGVADREDVLSIIAYLRTLKPAGTEQPPTALAFPFSLIARTIPKPAAHQRRPEGDDSVALGRYLVSLAGCMHCHTPVDEHHQPLAGMEGAGGQEYRINSKGAHVVVRPPNITPDADTGIGRWDKATFLTVIRTRAKSIGEPAPFGATNHIMPYRELSHLTDRDLGAIFDYLRTLAPVKHPVTRFERL